MADPGTALVWRNGRRVTVAANLAARTPGQALGVSAQQRMIGWNAGMPMGGLGDKVMRTTGAIPLRGEAPSQYQQTGTTVRIRGWERHPVVQSCIRAIVDIASAVPLQVYKKRPAQNASGFSDAIEVLTSEHPLQQLLDAPNSFMSAQRYRGFLMMHYIGYGNGLTFLERPVPANLGGGLTGTPGSAIDTNTKLPVSLRLIHPEDITTVYVNHKGYPLWYIWLDTLGYPHTSPVQDIFHVRDLSMKGLVFGFPRAASALNDIIGDDEASQFVRQIVTNNGQPIGYALVNEETTQEEASIAEAAMYEKMVTRGGRGRFLFLGGVTDVKSLAFDLSKLEFPDLRRVAREDICAAFQVDPRMVGITTATRDAGLSGTQYIEARVRLIKQAIEPMMRGIESELNHWVAPEFGADTFVRFDPDALAALAEDKDATSKRVTGEVFAGIRSIQEAREVVELDPEWDEDDTLAHSSTVVIESVEAALTPAAPPTVPALTADGSPVVHPETGAPLHTAPAPATAPLHPETGDDVPDDDEEVVAEDAGTADGAPKTVKGKKGKKGKAVDDGTNKDAQTVDPNNPGSGGIGPKDNNGAVDPKAKRAIGRILQRGVVLTGEQRTMLWKQFDVRASKEEAPFKRQALQLFGEERSNVEDMFARTEAKGGPDEETKARAVRTQVKRAYKPGGEVRARWTDRFHPLIAGVYAKGADQIVASLKARRSEVRALRKGDLLDPPRVVINDPDDVTSLFDFDLQNPAVQQAIRDRAKRLAELVGDTTGELVTEAIDFGISEGLSMREIAKLVDQTAFGGGNAARATLIARTETASALNAGEFDTAGASGIMAGKEWLTQGDDRVRDDHYDAEAEGMIALGDLFESTDMLYPGDPSGDADQVCNCRCFAPGTLVRGAFVGGTRSVYAGPMREIRTLLGRRLSVTPNHPILTAQGLRPAGSLNVGDDLLCDREVVGGSAMARSKDFDHDQTPARIEDVFDALAVAHAPRRTQVRAHDFHGDAAGHMGEVYAIAPDHVLRRQPVVYGDRGGDLADMGTGRSEPCGPQLSLDAGGAHSLPFEFLGGRTSADRDASFAQVPRDNGARDAECRGNLFEGISRLVSARDVFGVEDMQAVLSAPCRSESATLNAVLHELATERGITNPDLHRETVLRFAGEVTTDEIVEIRDYEFRGHVYDLMSTSGLIIADGIIASNCSLLYYDTLEEGASSIENPGEAMSISGKTVTIRGVEYALLALPASTNGTH
jgi:HK97 family phage portal protein